MAGVELTSVSKSFGEAVIINRLSLSIASGEFMVFLGPSGCGKSTLLRMIAGLESIDAGTITIGGRRVDPLPPGERGVAMVFQHYALYPHMTVRENMGFGLRNKGMSKPDIAERVAKAAAMLEIDALLDRKPGQMSGGQKQRVAIGRAIVKEPELFLFDEPLSNLDAGLRVRTRVELAQLHQRLPITTIFVTHDQVEAMTLADRIVVLNAGRIEQIGTPIDIYNRPASAFVAAFVGSPTINLLPVDVEADGGVARVRLQDGATLATRLPAPPAANGPWRIGVRSEAVSVVAADAGDTRGVAQVVERLGDRTLVHTRLADAGMIVAVDGGMSDVASGDQVGLRIDPAGMHLFDGEGRAHRG